MEAVAVTILVKVKSCVQSSVLYTTPTLSQGHASRQLERLIRSDKEHDYVHESPERLLHRLS